VECRCWCYCSPCFPLPATRFASEKTAPCSEAAPAYLHEFVEAKMQDFGNVEGRFKEVFVLGKMCKTVEICTLQRAGYYSFCPLSKKVQPG